jgi:hypothetical protein
MDTRRKPPSAFKSLDGRLNLQSGLTHGGQPVILKTQANNFHKKFRSRLTMVSGKSI